MLLTSIAFTRTSTTPEVPLGTQQTFIHPTYGIVKCAYILNGSAGAYAQGDLLRVKASQSSAATTDVQATAVINRQLLVGVCDHAIPQNSYGWCITNGVCKIKGDGSVTGGSPLVTDATAGRSKALPSGPANAQAAQDNACAVFGLALEDDGAAGSVFTARVSILS